MPDLVSLDLRKVEREVDAAFLSNPLTRLPFAEAAWYVLAFFEDLAVMEVLNGPPTSHIESIAFFDSIINKLQYPLSWLFHACPMGGSPPLKYEPSMYEASRQITTLATDYEAFVSAFTYASRGVIHLQLLDQRIQLSQPFYKDPRYDAYDRLTLPTPVTPDFSKVNIIELVDHAMTVKQDTFHYPLSRRLIAKSMQTLRPIMRLHFELPDTWVFPRYTLAEFRSVASLLVALGHIHFIAHLRAAKRGCLGGGYSSSVLLLSRDRLEKLLLRICGLTNRAANALIGDLVYGSRGVIHPDPALQPLIPLSPDILAIPPSLFVATSTERNFIALLNRLPSERKVYLRLVGEKEAQMRARVRLEAEKLGFRCHSGRVFGRQDLPDIDIALISDGEKCALVLELKWFLAPAEPREVMEKAAEIQTGLIQVQALRNAFTTDPREFLATLALTPEHSVIFAVASQNSIGDERSQDPSIPVVNVDHFIRKLRAYRSLSTVASWLRNRDYLPIEGTDFRERDEEYTVGRWTLPWPVLEVLQTSDHHL